jgi:hypothetical protein
MSVRCPPGLGYLALGAASSLALMNIIQSGYYILTTVSNKRKFFTFFGSISLFIACVLNTIFYLDNQYRDTTRLAYILKFQALKTAPFMIALCCLSVASAHRYFTFHSGLRKEFNEILLTVVFVADCMFALGISMNYIIYNQNRLWLAILLVIPLSHIAFGGAMYLTQLKEKIGSETAGYNLARWQIDLNLVMVSFWIGTRS